MTVRIYEEPQRRRLMQVDAQRWVSLGSFVFGMVAVGALGARYVADAAKPGSEPIAVLDKCGQPLGFSMIQAADWQPDEGFVFEKLQEFVECTRGLKLPATSRDRSCWTHLPAMSATASDELNKYMRARFGNDPKRWQALIATKNIAITHGANADKTADGRYRLNWTEEGDRATAGSWSAVFEVARVVVTKEAVSKGDLSAMSIENFTWSKDQSVGRQ